MIICRWSLTGNRKLKNVLCAFLDISEISGLKSGRSHLRNLGNDCSARLMATVEEPNVTS